MRKAVVWNLIRNEYGNGSWSFDEDHRLVTVVTAHGKKCTQLGGLPLEHLVNVLMREIRGEALPDAY
jgi:hypothetical protein